MFRRVVLIGALLGVLGCFLADRTISKIRTKPDTGTPRAAASGIRLRESSQPPSAFSKKDPNHHRQPLTTASNSPAVAPLSRRLWDDALLDRLQHASVGDPIEFELTEGQTAAGTVHYVARKGGKLTYISGDLEVPESGRFFFQRQSLPGKAGKFAGVVELPQSQSAYRVEPSADSTRSELVGWPLEKVICLGFPTLDDGRSVPEEIPPLNPSDFVEYPVPDYQEGIVALQSRPGASAVLFIDYRGGYTPTWGGIAYARPDVSNADIRNVWKRVAEDFMPFDVNVTTDAKAFDQAPENSRQRCIVTTTTAAAPGAGGVAYLNSWNWTGDIPCWAFYTSGKTAAEVIAHEFGHTLSLSHDGQSGVTGYYAGQGSGETGWAPIMGVGYYKNVTQWSKGEYAGANNLEDDLARMAANNNRFACRADDTGPTLASSRYLEIYPNATAAAEGVIETTGDTDAFQFTTSGGWLSLQANPVGDWGDLAIAATLCDAADSLLVSNNPQGTLWAAISTNLPAGTYTFRVAGAGRNDPSSNGFSNYGSLGYYSITGSVANPRLPDRFTVLENSPNGTLVGVIRALKTGKDPLTFEIISGNHNNAFSTDAAGNFRVANTSALDYEGLSPTGQFPVQFELLVNILDTARPALSEYSRRVVVALVDVNEPPVASDLSISLLEHTQTGTVLGQVSAWDPDAYNQLSFSILDGDGAGIFTIGSQDGVLRLSGDLNFNTQSRYELKIQVSDQVNPNPLTTLSTVTVSVLANATPLHPGSIACALYQNISGNLISALTNSPVFPADPDSEQMLSTFETPSDQSDNFGAVVRGFVIPPASGAYTFWIASDDNGDLFLSPSTNPASMTCIAQITGDGSYATARDWNKYPSQRSTPQSLVAGQAYYIEARQKEGVGADNLAVAWSGPTLEGTNVIPGFYLAPFRMNYRPRVTGFSTQTRQDAFAGTRLGRVSGNDVNTADVCTFSILSGNDDGLFSINRDGWVQVADPSAMRASPTDRTLVIRASESRSISLAATTSVSIALLAADAMVPGTLQRELFYNLGSGTSVADLLASAKFPSRPDDLQPVSALASRTNVADRYGSRIRGYLVPPLTGDYQFFIASDDAAQLKLSPDQESANAEIIASVNNWTSPWEWTKEGNQVSAVRSLVAGREYYLEALHKDGTGTDHLEAAWTGPGWIGTNVIDSACLEPINLNYPPDFYDQTLDVFGSAPNGTYVGTITAVDSPLDTLAFRIEDGNIGGAFAVDPPTGDLRVVDNTLLLNGLVTNWNLTVAAQDSGYGGRYPLASRQATVTVGVLPATANFLWTGADPLLYWSKPDNWRGAVPSVDSRLVFGYGPGQNCTNDDLATIDSIAFTNGGFVVAGSPILLKSGIVNAGTNTWSIPTTLTASQTWLSSSGLFTVSGPTDNSGHDLTINAVSDVRFLGSVSGNGSLVKTGGGILWLAGSHAYTGPTVIEQGTFALTTSARIDSSSSINIGRNGAFDVTAIQGLWTVAPAQVLRGSGTNGNTTGILGSITPGQGVGPLTIKGNAGLAGTTVLQISKTGSLCTNDSLNCSGLLQPGGTLVITNTGSGALAAGDVFKVLRAASFGRGQFDRLVLPALPTGLGWNTLLLTKDGSLRVATEPLTPPALSITANAGLLTVYWPTDYFSYVLSAQTNNSPAGLGGNWNLVPNLFSNAFTLPIDKSNASVFLRLSRP
jgi:autotransporter-associated beta strand protein